MYTSCFYFGVFLKCLSFLLDERICSPPFMVLNTECSPDVLEDIKKQGLTFPFSECLHLTSVKPKVLLFSVICLFNVFSCFDSFSSLQNEGGSWHQLARGKRLQGSEFTHTLLPPYQRTQTPGLSQDCH